MATQFCQKCQKTMDATQFYTYKDGRKTELCKKCLTMHMNAFDESTFLWALEKMDVPYIPAEWAVLRDKAYEKDPKKFNTAAIFGKYLSKMKLSQWNKYAWADGPRLIAEAQAQEEERLRISAETDEFYRQKYEAGEISEAEFKTLTSTTSQHEAAMGAPSATNPYLGPDNPYNESNFFNESDMPNLGAGLTQEDKLTMAMKWGRLYTPDEWVILERSYREMTNSFDIQDADTMSTLILICKTNLKMNQALDSGDIEAYQKLAKVSESLRKSAKFTAAQNKEAKGDFVDSIGELVRLCEREGFIPRYATDIPQDKVDVTLQDMQGYLHKLVTQDLGFGQQIEDSLKKIMIQKEMNAAADQDYNPELGDEDFEAFYEEQERQKQLDQELIEEEGGDNNGIG